MNNKSLYEQLFNINKFLSINLSPDIYTIQNYASTIDISNILSITIDISFEILPPSARIDTVTEKILYLQYLYLTPVIVFSDRNCLLNSLSLIFTGNQTSVLQFRLAIIIKLMKHADFYLS
ncbi:hypothetical protein GLOIN_2v1789520 [Rhizophagus clarus]|uniref:Uncharacterized protein n=1 Tax=Rhizophagus clarus TaxID=94130 RepID=A0A8H3LP92_9GLOM|nr:hypothetical protein GLOIN_2v1789520 [Rhizophagus clarus]